MSSRVSLVVPVHGCGREVLGRVSLRVSFGMFLVVSDRGCGWKAGRCRGGCCLGRCWECRWWCLIAEWGGRCRGGCWGVVGGGRKECCGKGRCCW